MPMNASVSISPIHWNNQQKCSHLYLLQSLSLTRRMQHCPVKRDEPILAILGNPPYPQDSANPSSEGNRLTFIGELIEDYKPTDGKLLGIKDQTKFLQADYVKFIRWAQWRIDKNGEGIIGYIVNNNFLGGVTFRRMRQSLMKSFNAIYCFNLHGGSRIGGNCS